MIYEYECEVCGKEFEEVKSYKERENVFCCGTKAQKLICRNVHTDDDQMWNFVAGYIGNKPINIHSKQQHKRLLKKHGLVDETTRNCLTIKPKKESDHKYKRQRMIKNIQEQVHQDGLSRHFKPFVQEKFNNNRGG